MLLFFIFFFFVRQYILNLKTDTLSYEKEKENLGKKVDELKNTIDQLNNVSNNNYIKK